jgi:hypothetical protein
VINIPVLAVASAGGALPIPIVVHSGTGRFRILNFDATITYALRATAGSITRNGDLITLSNRNSIGTVAAISRKNIEFASSFQRRAYTFTRTQVGTTPTFPCNCVDNVAATCNEPTTVSSGFPLTVSCPGNCPCIDSFDRCICWRWGQPTTLCFATCGGDPIFADIKDPKPAGGQPEPGNEYVDQFGEYSRIFVDYVF